MASDDEDLTVHFFLSNLSHEIRTPLNGIVGYTQLLAETKLDSTQKMYAGSMNKCCIQLMSLINDILDFSKLATGKMRINNECFSFSEIISEVNSTLSLRITEKKQKCRFVISTNLPKYIISDKNKIIQILINLISNANKFTQIEGRIIINVIPIKMGMIEISVEDNGIGISDEEQTKLFHAFYQVQSSANKLGSGLGLAICKKLVELLSGAITVESSKGQGSKFIFTLKYEPFEEFQEQISQKLKILSGVYILVVDDNIDNRVNISEMLFDAGMNPIVCSSSKETLKMIKDRRYPFSMCLVDVCMPDIPGTVLAQKIRELEPDLSLIAFSSSDEITGLENFTSVIHKPVCKVKLFDSLIKILSKNSIDDCVLNTEKDEKVSSVDETAKHRENEPTQEKYPKILIAEDIYYNLQMLTSMLEKMGYPLSCIDTAENGKLAIEKLQTSRYDILLLDLKMPVMDGFQVIEYIQQHSKETGHLLFENAPEIIALTASVLDSDKDRCKEMGVKYFIVKPVNMSHLKKIMMRIWGTLSL